MRSLLLFLARQRLPRKFLESRAGKRFSSRFVAGTTIEDAIREGLRLYAKQLLVTVDHLGENVTTLSDAVTSGLECRLILRSLAHVSLEPNVSVKLSQLGIDFSENLCSEILEQIVIEAKSLGGFVRVDMESSIYVDRTLEIVHYLHRKHGNIGTVIQAYLLRSANDLEEACKAGMRIRLVKGAYREPWSVAYKRKADVDRAFAQFTEVLFDRGLHPAIATHDYKLIQLAKRIAESRRLDRGSYEFQLLYGIRPRLQTSLASEGFCTRVYLPYGQAWYPYLMRRLAERPANVLFLARNLLRG